MIWIISIMAAISILLTTYFVFYHPQKDHKRSKQIRQWIFGMLSLLGTLSIPFMLTIGNKIQYKWMNIILPIVFLAFMLLVGLSKRIYINNDRYYQSSLFTLKIIYIAVMVPLSTIYFFRREPLNFIILSTIIVFLCICIVFTIYQLLMRSKYAKVFRFIDAFKIIMVLIIVFAVNNNLYESLQNLFATTRHYDNSILLDVDYAYFEYFNWYAIYFVTIILFIPLIRGKQPWEIYDYPPNKDVEQNNE